LFTRSKIQAIPVELSQGHGFGQRFGEAGMVLENLGSGKEGNDSNITGETQQRNWTNYVFL